MHPVARVPIKHFFFSDLRSKAFCIYESPEDGHRSGLKHVVEVIHIKLQILLWTEVEKKCLTNIICRISFEFRSNVIHVKCSESWFILCGYWGGATVLRQTLRFLWKLPFVLSDMWADATNMKQQTKQTPWSESARELYRPSDRRLSVKWLPTFADRGCHVVSVTDPYGRILGFLDKSRYFSIK
jgi:hypothetical protein